MKKRTNTKQQPALRGALRRVREDPDTRFAVVFGAAFAWAMGFALGFLLGQREGADDGGTEPPHDA